jgi:hypothetical protein
MTKKSPDPKVIPFDSAAHRIYAQSIAKDLDTLDSALQSLTQRMLDRMVQMTPEDRQQIGQVLLDYTNPIRETLDRQQSTRDILVRGDLQEMINLRNQIQSRIDARTLEGSPVSSAEVIPFKADS